MVLDFDVKTFCQNLKATKPPYECPVRTCRKVYKSYSGIQFHMYNHNHDNPDSPGTGAAASPSCGGRKPGKRKQKNWHPRQARRSPTPPDFIRSPQRETLSYAESQRLVEIDLDGCLRRIDISQPIEIISQDEIENQDNTEKEENAEKSPSGRPVRNLESKSRKESLAVASLPPDINPNKLPEPHVKILTDYIKPNKTSTHPSSYYRYIEKSLEELDEEIEYDMDEEDHSWLELINDKRTSEGVAGVAQDTFELIMDRFEKEAFFQSQHTGKEQGPSMDDDAVCSICMDGECQNSNMILFCDMCNLAVHQECYGVPYIPEGQWLCRRCLQSPSRAVDCCLCPNKGGAFKQTDDGRWAHVVCALWIPEVGFANTVFLEPIDCLQRIPPARRKLTCYICKQRGAGACIQCHKTNCYTAFHVTCAQQAGLFMKIEAVKEPGPNGISMGVRKTAFCDVHAQPSADNSMFPDDEKKSGSKEDAREQARIKMRKARKILAQKRHAVPNVSIPIIPEERLTKIASMINVPKRDEFMRALMSYWTLKRQSRFGVPLLRRLQSNHMSRNREHSRNDKHNQEVREKLKYWQRLRQDLEKARLLVELIRKREKLKRELMKVYQLSMEYKLQPFIMLQRHTLNLLQEKDAEDIFVNPVSDEEAPDYKDIIKHPMCFSVMRNKVDTHRYKTMEAFEADFKLIIHNCCMYNAKDTVFYREALLLKEEGMEIIKDAKLIAEKVGYDVETGLHSATPNLALKEPVSEDFESVVEDVKNGGSYEEQLKVLLNKLERASKTLKGGKKAKIVKKIRCEIAAVRRKLSLNKKKTSKVKSKVTNKVNNKIVKLNEESQKEKSDHGEEEPREPEPQNKEAESDAVKKEEANKKENTSSEVECEGNGSVQPKNLKRKLKRSPSRSPLRTSTPLSTASSRGGRGRGRGRGGRSRTGTILSENLQISVHPGEKNKTSEQSSPASPAAEKTESKETTARGTNVHTPSPAGVNRRTAVLFSSKKGRSTPVPTKPSSTTSSASSNASSASNTSTLKKVSGRGAKTRQHQQQLPVKVTDITTEADKTAEVPLSPRSTRGPGLKRTSSVAGHPIETLDTQPAPVKRSCSAVTSNEIPPPTSVHVGGPDINESFKAYRIRGNIRSSSESETTDELSSGDESLSEPTSETSSNNSPSGRARTTSLREGPEGSDLAESISPATSPLSSGRNRRSPSIDSEDLITLEPLDLVWAKCRGYPWYPALIINPKMPKTGYFHNGVPIPVPPDEVLELQHRYSESVYLVLFFDTKRTWQWLPRSKLEPLGVNSDLDKAKLMENKKPNVRNAVKKAYEKAIVHRCRVRGDPNPLSDDSSSDNNGL
ncbi:bromodomain and PHD finger-containing protein 3-like isoform X1 [Biomphalaria glabrata]|uniref:Bromodomain and PHD finger-containing protein 3-like isoform X1 n=1 Tax=Biomphalaria glabrata TaxID=6526 RepID=A0A9U8EKN1_BIOGL|nr:bromodomain and PHD finger-containing protein 3-like isoform X1 [Biomphalaria glabrata]XP_013091609.2 bromodomain and PHD finger-containing protein 3-like isoform X1 [Biomphalaria glabrata]XP_055881556.1 bromodomain and PHD finger-containing protein 3-like isoform X1 [Biomphalaria glabrata]KAI8763989.1 peregrin isoform X1 [Biomphalaria glabrata]